MTCIVGARFERSVYLGIDGADNSILLSLQEPETEQPQWLFGFAGDGRLAHVLRDAARASIPPLDALKGVDSVECMMMDLVVFFRRLAYKEKILLKNDGAWDFGVNVIVGGHRRLFVIGRDTVLTEIDDHTMVIAGVYSHYSEKIWKDPRERILTTLTAMAARGKDVTPPFYVFSSDYF